mmetsp:Transcript_163001/g.517732  ORF Transcript_163001/g.517732 Transcript_163001/m.517732 type:complete len:203 (-) Transcript_163001:323-931(-)
MLRQRRRCRRGRRRRRRRQGRRRHPSLRHPHAVHARRRRWSPRRPRRWRGWRWHRGPGLLVRHHPARIRRVRVHPMDGLERIARYGLGLANQIHSLHRFGLIHVFRLRLPIQAESQGELHCVVNIDALNLILVNEDVRAKLRVRLRTDDEAEALRCVVGLYRAGVDLVRIFVGQLGLLYLKLRPDIQSSCHLRQQLLSWHSA